jgi:hypothetical protein
MKHGFTILLLIIIGIVFIGCETMRRGNIAKMYPGPMLGKDQIAYLESPPGIRVIKVDGEKIGSYPYKNVFELLPGDHTIVLNYVPNNDVRNIITVQLSFQAKAGFDYYIRSIKYCANGKSIYSFPYTKIAMEKYDKNAIECREKLSLDWVPSDKDLKWTPYVLENGHQRQISKYVFDWDYKGFAKLLPESYDKQFTNIKNTIQEQQRLAKECLKEDAEMYFTGTRFYEFPK